MTRGGPVDVTVIGGGIVGLATAHALSTRRAGTVRLIEKEATLARHQSSHNSGVLHAGLQYTPGSEKARLAHAGIRRMTDFCARNDIPHEICGKLVVATNREELPRLDAMLERGRANGLNGLARLTPEGAREIEPHVDCAGAIVVPEEGIADYAHVASVLAAEITELGVDIRTSAELRGLVREGSGWRVETAAGDFASRVIVNCAGLYADRVAMMAGDEPPCRTLPFRGEYWRLTPEREHLVRHLIYPLPEPGFPFLGLHFTRRIGGGIDAGPNAVLAFAREGYDLRTVDVPELFDALSYPGLWRFAIRHRRMVARELAQSFDRSRFVRALQRLVPEVTENDLLPGGSGVRAQAVLPSGDFVHDFLWVESRGAVHAVNTPSPAATASLVIGEAIADRAVTHLT